MTVTELINLTEEAANGALADLELIEVAKEETDAEAIVRAEAVGGAFLRMGVDPKIKWIIKKMD